MTRSSQTDSRGPGDPVSQTASVSPVVDSAESADQRAFEAALATDFVASKKPAEGEVISGVIAKM